MALNYGETFLDAVAGLSGKTSYEVWQSGNNWKDIVKHAESVLGKQKKWSVFEGEGGQGFIIGANGRIINFGSAAGEAQSYTAANQLVTDAVVEESGALTSYYGNIVDTHGSVTKKGLALGASTGAKVVGGALAAFGAVATGVNWYRDNPEFWTDVSQKLLPFAYKDPTNKSWGDIFYDALVPTAVDDEGNTYVPADLMESLAHELVSNGFFIQRNYSTVTPELESFYPRMPEAYKNREFNYTVVNTWKARLSDSASVELSDTYRDSVYYWVNNNPSTLLNYPGYDVYGGPQAFCKSANESLAYSGRTTSNYTPANGQPLYGFNTGLPGGAIYRITPYIINNIEDLPSPTGLFTQKNALIAYIIMYGLQHSESPFDNISIPSDSTVPTDTGTLSEQFPDWFKNAQTTVNPNWKPGEPESKDNPKYVVWLPVQMPSEDTPDGDTEPDTDQDTAQKGKPTPKPSVDPTTDSAITDGVIPDPYPSPEDTPSLNPDPQPDPSPDPTPDPTDPSDPTSVPTPTPTPGVPSIGGGSANALWKIYNPSQATLQQFGAWLWSDNPLELIKQIFSNSPAEGVVGLHMIYVKPPIGGTANIKVGYLDSGVASPWVSQQYVSFDCGSVTVPLAYQSALDFGYTKVYCYLPFIGIVPLDSFDIIGKTVSIKYTVDVLTGAVLAQISVSSGSYNAVLYTFNGSCSVEYPLTAGTRASQLLSLVTGAVGGAVVGGVGGAVMGGIRGAATGADVRMSGNLSGNAGAMGIRKPYLIVKRPVEVAARSYNSFYGYPANITGLLSSFSGYTRVKSAHVENITRASDTERDMIMNALRDGVIV